MIVERLPHERRCHDCGEKASPAKPDVEHVMISTSPALPAVVNRVYVVRIEVHQCGAVYDDIQFKVLILRVE